MLGIFLEYIDGLEDLENANDFIENSHTVNGKDMEEKYNKTYFKELLATITI